eukprot:XP_001608752.1 hypothetical protein [Babesia bovis T2Bo]
MDDDESPQRRHKTFRIAKRERSTVSEATAAPSEEDTTPLQCVDNGLDALIPDIEDYISESMTAQNNDLTELPPVIKFRKNWSLSVTDLSAQLWCEKQIELVLITGRKRVTKEMELGTERHEALELEDHDIVEVEVFTNEDYLGIKLLNSINLLEQLMSSGKCREVWVFGNFHGYVIRGIIDQLEIITGANGKKQILISDTKTRKQRKKPSMSQVQGASLQVQTYGIILEELRNNNVKFEKLYESFECDKLAPFVSEELVSEGCLAKLEQRFLKMFASLPEIATTMQLSYEHGGEVFETSEIPLQKESTMYTIQYLCDFWEGHRQAEPVVKRESWKCKICEFQDECEVTPLVKPANKQVKTDPGQITIDAFLQKTK